MAKRIRDVELDRLIKLAGEEVNVLLRECVADRRRRGLKGSGLGGVASRRIARKAASRAIERFGGVCKARVMLRSVFRKIELRS